MLEADSIRAIQTNFKSVADLDRWAIDDKFGLPVAEKRTPINRGQLAEFGTQSRELRNKIAECDKDNKRDFANAGREAVAAEKRLIAPREELRKKTADLSATEEKLGEVNENLRQDDDAIRSRSCSQVSQNLSGSKHDIHSAEAGRRRCVRESQTADKRRFPDKR